jgi:hypothetical protein
VAVRVGATGTVELDIGDRAGGAGRGVTGGVGGGRPEAGDGVVGDRDGKAGRGELGAADRVTLRQLRFTRRLVERYGTEASRFAQAEATDSLDPLVDGLPVLRAEAVFAFRDEGALTAEDVVDRRLRLGAVPAERELAIAAVQDLAESLDLPLMSAPETAAGETSSSGLMRQRESNTLPSG